MLNSLKLLFLPRVLQCIHRMSMHLSRLWLVQYKRTLECIALQNMRLLASNSIYFSMETTFSYPVVFCCFYDFSWRFGTICSWWTTLGQREYKNKLVKKLRTKLGRLQISFEVAQISGHWVWPRNLNIFLRKRTIRSNQIWISGWWNSWAPSLSDFFWRCVMTSFN
jgi:hypothetical protein